MCIIETNATTKNLLYLLIATVVFNGCKGDRDNSEEPCVVSTLTANIDFKYRGFMTIKNSVAFMDLCTGDKEGIAYLWDFGDSTTSTEANPKHSYKAARTYEVNLKVKNACGRISEAKLAVKINSIPVNVSGGMQRVAQPNKSWSWAACAEMVLSSYYHPTPQCYILSETFKADCCKNPSLCPQQGTLKQICSNLKFYGGLSSVIRDSILTYEEIMIEIANGRPVIIEYNNLEEGHLAVIYAYDNSWGQKYVMIFDPVYEDPDRRYKDFEVQYNSTYTYKGQLKWTRTIYMIADNY